MAAVRITFYEQVDGQIRVADIEQPAVGFRLKGGLSNGRTYQELSAAYEVPKGQGRPGRSYFGTLVQVEIDGETVETVSDSPPLLDLLPDGPAAGNGSLPR